MASRSAESIVAEVQAIAQTPQFHGTISDLGGPTANLWGAACTDDAAHAVCRRPSCVHPGICRFFEVDHGPLVELYEKARKVKGVKHLFVGSGVRYDLAQADRKNGDRYVKALVAHHG